MAEIKPDANGIVHLQSADAKKHGLPPVNIQVDISGTGVTANEFVHSNNYLTLSGPPGGIYRVQVDQAADNYQDANRLKELVEKKFDSDPKFKLGFTDQVALSGENYTSVSYVLLDPAFHNSAGCTFFVPSMKKKSSGLLVTLEHSGPDKPLMCAKIIELFEPMIRTMHFRFE